MLSPLNDRGLAKKYEPFFIYGYSNTGNESADGEKCYQYWPNTNLPEVYGDIEVEILSERLEGYKVTYKWIVTEFMVRREVR